MRSYSDRCMHSCPYHPYLALPGCTWLVRSVWSASCVKCGCGASAPTRGCAMTWRGGSNPSNGMPPRYGMPPPLRGISQPLALMSTMSARCYHARVCRLCSNITMRGVEYDHKMQASHRAWAITSTRLIVLPIQRLVSVHARCRLRVCQGQGSCSMPLAHEHYAMPIAHEALCHAPRTRALCHAPRTRGFAHHRTERLADFIFL